MYNIIINNIIYIYNIINNVYIYIQAAEDGWI